MRRGVASDGGSISRRECCWQFAENLLAGRPASMAEGRQTVHALASREPEDQPACSLRVPGLSAIRAGPTVVVVAE